MAANQDLADRHVVQVPGQLDFGQGQPHHVQHQQPQTEQFAPMFGAVQTERLAGPVGDVADSNELGVTLHNLIEYLAITISLKKSCCTLPLTVLLWLSYLLVVFSHSGSEVSFQSANYVRSHIEGCRATLPGEGDLDFGVYDLVDHRQIMPWIDRALVPVFQVSDVQQVVLGFVRVQQIRGENSSCALLSEELQAVYGSDCYPNGGQVYKFGPRRASYALAEPAFQTVSKAGNKFEFWLEVNRSKAVVSKRIRTLANEGWVDLRTQQIQVEGLFLNVEENVYTHFIILFQMPREGGVMSTVTAYPMRGEVYNHWGPIFIDIFWICLFVVILYSLVTDLMIEHNRGLLKVHLQDRFVWLDVGLVLLGLILIIIFSVNVIILDKFTVEVFELGVMPPLSVAEASVAQKVLVQVQETAFQDKLTLLIDWVKYFADQSKVLRFFSCLYAVLMVFRFFRGFRGQPRIAVLVQTFLHAAGFISHFFLLLLIVFGNFALGGYILFGDSLKGWNTPVGAVSKTILVFFLRFDYQDFHQVHPVASGVWFTSFFLLVIVLLQRVLAAAIVEAYVSVRAALGEPGATVLEQLRQAFREMRFLRSYRGAQKSVPYEELLNILATDVDPAYIKKLGNRQVDRRLRTRAQLTEVESSATVDVDFLMQRGCDRVSAERLLRQCAVWTHSISVTSSPLRRLLIMLVRQMHHMKFEADHFQEALNRKFDRSAKVVDRFDLKHAKCLSLARRMRKGQQLPPGWTAHTDQDGRRFLRQTETGLTSWTLPKYLL